MKKNFSLLAFVTLFAGSGLQAQVFAPISTTGYTLDAVAENTTAMATTGGAIDGSNYVLYSASYGAIYSLSTGLPNNGLIASGTRTYQLQTYTTSNMLYLLPGILDSLTLSTPAPYSGLSLLGFGTEGAPTMIITVRFTDNTTQVYTGQTLADWFGTGSAIISGFDRVSRTSGTPAQASGNPKMYALDLVISCANRAKNVKNIKVQNSGTVGRVCIMAASGSAMPLFSVSSQPVTCSGGTNGSAAATGTGGVLPYTYTWSTNPVQTGPVATNLAVGIYSLTAADAGSCAVTTTVAVTQSLAVQPPLNVASNFYTVCAGANVNLTASGASTYTWSTLTVAPSTTAAPLTTTTYTVGGYTSANCYLTGSVSIFVNPLPVINFTVPTSLCINSPSLVLTASPTGGTYSGQSVISGAFHPNFAGVGTKTITYVYTNSNNCTASVVNTLNVYGLPVLSFTVSQVPLCTNSPTLTLNATPGGGTYTGTGVNGSVFTPSQVAAGVNTVNYVYTDQNNCTNSITSGVTINAEPQVSIVASKTLYCVFSQSAVFNGSPGGGTFSGPGMNGSTFTPGTAGVGSHTIAYSYTDPNNCSGTALKTITVSACTGIAQANNSPAAFIVYPNPNKGTFTIRFAINGEFGIFNELGQELRTIKADVTGEQTIQVEGLSPGIYLLTGLGEAGSIKMKIIVTQ